MSLFCFVWLLAAVHLRADTEADLIDQYNAIVNALNADQFDEARRGLDEFEKAAGAIAAGDPAHKRAQALLKQTSRLRLTSYHNSAIQAKNAADQAVASLQLDEAARHFMRFAADSVELARLEPENKSYQQQQRDAEQQLAQIHIVQAVLASRPLDEKQLQVTASEKLKQLFESAPGFLLPRIDQPGFVQPLHRSGQVVVLQVFQAADDTAAFAVASAKSLIKTYGPRGLDWLSVSIDQREGVARLEEFLAAHKPDWPVALDDRGDFYQQYMQGGFHLPAYVVVGRDRKACWFSGSNLLETTAAVAAKIQRELERPEADLPAGPSCGFPIATPCSVTHVADASPAMLEFGDQPTLMVVAFEVDDGPHWYHLAEVAQEYRPKLRVIAVARSEQFAPVKQLADKYSVTFHQIRWGMPASYGPNYPQKLVLVSRGGRILKVVPLTDDAEHVRALLKHSAQALVHPGAYPSDADVTVPTNLVHRAYGGRVEQVSSAQQRGREQRLTDGVTGGEGWQPQGKLPQEFTLSFLDRKPATVSRLVMDRRAGLGQFEVLAADAAAGPFRSLGRFQAEERDGLQSFALPHEEAAFLKIRMESAVGRGSPRVEIGEVEVHGPSDGALASRLQSLHATKELVDKFDEPDLAFWEQTDFVFGLGAAEWRAAHGRLEVSGLPSIGELRATALLRGAAAPADFHLTANVRSRGNQASGVVFNFRDWNNHLRLVLVQGHVQTGRSEGNSIRLEQWEQGQLRVLGVHGEPFPHGEPIRLEILRQGTSLAVLAQDRVLFALDDVSAPPGQIGFCAAGGGGFEVDDMQLSTLADNHPRDLVPPRQISTAAGASLVWLNSQRSHDQPQAWASQLLRNSVFLPPAAWEATRQGDDSPTAIFAFRDQAEVLLQGVQFELPAVGGGEADHRVRKVEVLVSSHSPLQSDSFRSAGEFSLKLAAGPQVFRLDEPLRCRFVKLRLLESVSGEAFSLAGFDVQLGEMPDASTELAQARRQAEERFQTAADDAEQEPNDTTQQASPLGVARSLDATIHFGETDYFRIPPPPTARGSRTLRLQIDALPWLRIKADVLDQQGASFDPPLAEFLAGQHADWRRTFAAGARLPEWLRVEMPPASIAMVLDTSGSMGGREPDVRAAVNSYLSGAGESEQIEVIEFNTDVSLVGRLPAQRDRVNEAVERLGAHGNTALYEALLVGMKQNQAVVLLSDGMNTVFKTDFPAFCRQLRERPVPIYVIGIGWDLHEYDANSGNTAYNLLENLARQTGGRFYFSPDSQGLQQLYEEIGREIRGQSRYRVRAEWEVNDRGAELAVTGRSSAGVAQAFASPLPVKLPELTVGRAGHAGTAPRLVDLPSPEVDLAPAPRTRSGPAWAALPSAGAAELATIAARVSSRPQVVSLPPLADLTVRYTPAMENDPSLPPAVLPAFELIFDSSESMQELLEGRPKIDVARQVMNELVDALPADTQVGLRLYGHWGQWIAAKTNPQAGKVSVDDPRLNTDSDLVVSIGPLDARQRGNLKRWINWTQPRGKTPMVYSLLEARKDFSPDWKGPRTVILVSDGIETCGGKLEDLAQAYEQAGIGAVIHVVGFDIAGTEAESQLREIARLGRGQYHGAQNARQLAEALQSAARAGAFGVFDAEGREVARGVVNDQTPTVLVPGDYRVRMSQVKADELKITITNDSALQLELRDDGSFKPIASERN